LLLCLACRLPRRCLCMLVQEWAGLLASPHVLRVADACATAEDAALGAALAGKGAPFVTQAVGVCLKGLYEWQHGDTQVGSCCRAGGPRQDGVQQHSCVTVSAACSCCLHVAPLGCLARARPTHVRH
jgi:hypothetical protein